MDILRAKSDMTLLSRSWSRQGRIVGFVPTMGALHEGHASLIRIARAEAGRVVVSLFVNPTQFGPDEDFDRYPRQEESDIALCRSLGADAVFAPSAETMYPPDSSVTLQEQRLSRGLCGAFRPGHFNGVLTVVCKLFHVVRPDVAVFGRKDAQQLALIERMVRDLDFPVRIVAAPIVREPDGLAMSSRNARLSPAERGRALALKRALDRAERDFANGVADADALRRAVSAELGRDPGLRIEYVALVDARTLEPVRVAGVGTLVALAAHVGDVRLIDNTVLGA